MGYIDLHVHTKYSDDGEFTPKEIVEKCLASGIKLLAIADHNSVKGIKEGSEFAKENGIGYVNASELDCMIGSIRLHVLGYRLKTNFEVFDAYEEDILSQELEISKKRIEAVRSVGIVVDEKKVYALSPNGVINGEMIAEAALADRQNDEKLKEYLPGGGRSDNPYVNFYWDYFGKGEFASLKPKFMDLKSAVKMITDAGGIPVLAHPGQNISEDRKVLEEIIECGVKGIEVFSSYHTKEQVAFYDSFAKEKALLETIGSDFHGKTKPSIYLGQSMADEEIQQKVLNYFMSL